MKEKCLNKFVKLFDRFTAVAFFVGNKVSDNIANPLTGIDVLIDDLIRCNQIYENHEEWNILQNALDEVKQNLWDLSQDNRILYLKSVIRKFADISLYTNNDYILCLEDIKTGTCSKKGSYSQYLYLLQIQEFLKDTQPFHKQTPAQQYIFSCAETLYCFECKLGRICKDFEINFAELQEDLGIYLRKWKEYEGNYSYVEFKLSIPERQSVATNISSTNTIGNLSAEATKKLFNLLTPDILDYADIESFCSSLRKPQRLKIKKQNLAWTFYKFGYNNIMDGDITLCHEFKSVFKTYITKKNGKETLAERTLKKAIEEIIKQNAK